MCYSVLVPIKAGIGRSLVGEEGRLLVQGRSNPRSGEIESPYRGEAYPVQGRSGEIEGKD